MEWVEATGVMGGQGELVLGPLGTASVGASGGFMVKWIVASPPRRGPRLKLSIMQPRSEWRLKTELRHSMPKAKGSLSPKPVS